MEATAATSAINAILGACDVETRAMVLKEIIPKQAAKKVNRKRMSILQAKEDLLTNYFKQ